MHFIIVAIVTFIVGAFASSALAQNSAIPAQDKELLEFAAELEALGEIHHLPGFAVALLRDQKLIFSKGYGFVDSDRKVPVTPDTPFWIASVTKTFVGLAFLHLESEKRIKLSDRINDTPGFANLCRWLAASTLPFGRDLRCDAPITVGHILSHQVQGEPGSSFSYNPIMYSRLSRYLEHKFGGNIEAVEGTHNALARTIDRVILEPAGMERTMSSQWDRTKPFVYFDMTEGFGIDESDEWIKRSRPERHIAGGAGIVSTVLDLAKYDITIDRGVIASPAIKKKLFTPARLNDGSVSPYAIGWYVQEYRGIKLVWHSGWDEEAGFSALYLKVPERNLTLIVLANGEGLKWGNPLHRAEVDKSPFARALLDRFVAENEEKK